MKAIEQYFHVVLFIILYKVVLTFKSVDKNTVCVTIQMKAIKRFLNVHVFVMFSMLLKTTLLFLESVDETQFK